MVKTLTPEKLHALVHLAASLPLEQQDELLRNLPLERLRVDTIAQALRQHPAAGVTVSLALRALDLCAEAPSLPASPEPLTPEQRAAILESIEATLSPARAAAAQGVTAVRWAALLQTDQELAGEVAQRDASAEDRLVKMVANGDAAGGAERLLALRWPERYGKKASRKR